MILFGLFGVSGCGDNSNDVGSEDSSTGGEHAEEPSGGSTESAGSGTGGGDEGGSGPGGAVGRGGSTGNGGALGNGGSLARGGSAGASVGGALGNGGAINGGGSAGAEAGSPGVGGAVGVGGAAGASAGSPGVGGTVANGGSAGAEAGSAGMGGAVANGGSAGAEAGSPGAGGAVSNGGSAGAQAGSPGAGGAIAGGGSGGEGGNLCPIVHPCENWCDGDAIFDSLGCNVGAICENGVNPCTTEHCASGNVCTAEETCMRDGLCWPNQAPQIVGTFEYQPEPCFPDVDPCGTSPVAVITVPGDPAQIYYLSVMDRLVSESEGYDWQSNWNFSGETGSSVIVTGQVHHHGDANREAYVEIQLAEITEQ